MKMAENGSKESLYNTTFYQFHPKQRETEWSTNCIENCINSKGNIEEDRDYSSALYRTVLLPFLLGGFEFT